jgi:alanyl-tRNA synthetase
MQQHTGQHILSAAFDHLFAARTESFHLGSDGSTIDLGREVSAAQIAAAEREACRVVWDDVPVSIRFVSEEEAARLPLRKEPARGGQLRLIEVAGFDLSACGGTHVSRTGEVGIVAVRGSERFRGGTRIEFVCGARALAAFQTLREAVSGAIRHVSVHPAELPDAIARLQADLKDQRKMLRDQATKLADYQAVDMAAAAEAIAGLRAVIAAPEGYDAAGIKALASAVVKTASMVAVIFTATAPMQVVDCAALLRGLFDRSGGKGGGKPDLAQGGGLAAPVADLIAAARAAIAGSSDSQARSSGRNQS